MKIKTPIFLAIFIALITISCSKESLESIESSGTTNAVEMEIEMVSMVNDYRATKNLTPLTFSAVAYKHANAHNDYMISKGILSHDNFQARANSISSETEATLVSENVAKDYTKTIDALEKWLSSDRHRRTIEGAFTNTAVSVKQDAAGNFFFTQLFYK